MLRSLFLLCSAFLRIAQTNHAVTHPSQVDCTENGLMGLVITKSSWECGMDGSSRCYQEVTNCSSCEEGGSVEEGLRNYDENGQLTLSEGVRWDCRTEMCSERPGTFGSMEFPGYQYFDCKECDDEDDCLMPGMKCHLMTDTSCSCDGGRCKTNSRSGNAFSWFYYETDWWRHAGSEMVKVAVGPNYIWGIDEDDKIYVATDNSWTSVDGALKDISVGINSVWGVNSADSIYMWTSDKPLGHWTHIPGKLKQISVSGHDDSIVWGVNSGNSVYRWTGSMWQLVFGSLKMVSCGDAGVWGINTNNDIYYRIGTNRGIISAGSSWQRVDEAMEWISVGGAVEVWGGYGNKVYRRDGITRQDPTGTRWTEVVDINGEVMRHVDVYEDERLGVGSGNRVFYSDELWIVD